MNESRIRDIIYKRKNGEPLVNDPEAIKSCKTEQNRDIIDNARLGSYDKYGNYVIIPDIKRELISMPKLVYNSYTVNGYMTYDLKATIPIFGDLFLKLILGKDEAKLSITETVNRESGGYLEVYDEVIDSFPLGEERLPDSIIFRNYHIIEKPTDFGKRKTYAYNNILTKKVYLSLLSKELRKTSNIDEHSSFEKMISTLKQGGEYGKKVLDEFVSRLKDRPAIFEIENTDRYNKAVNEVLLSSLDVVTTEEDKKNYQNKQTYLAVLNARNENIEEELNKANSKVDQSYVKSVVEKATAEFDKGQIEESEENIADEFFSKLSGDKQATTRRRSLEKPVLKQGKDGKKEDSNGDKEKTKEEKIKEILDKKKQEKKTPANKKLKAAKGKSASSKKLKAGKGKSKGPAKGKGKAGKKGPKKAKLKGKKKKKLKKPGMLHKGKGKGKVFKPKPEGGSKKKKKKEEKNLHLKMGPLLKESAIMHAISTSSSNYTIKDTTKKLEEAAKNSTQPDDKGNPYYSVRKTDKQKNEDVDKNEGKEQGSHNNEGTNGNISVWKTDSKNPTIGNEGQGLPNENGTGNNTGEPTSDTVQGTDVNIVNTSTTIQDILATLNQS